MKLPVLCEGDYRGSGSITPVDVGSDYSALSIFPIWLSVSITTHHLLHSHQITHFIGKFYISQFTLSS